MADDKKANEDKESTEPKGASDSADEAQPGDGDSKEAGRARRLANLGGGGNAHVLKHRAAKRQRESTILSREELAVILSNHLRNKSLPAHAVASLARVFADVEGYSKGPPPEDTKPKLLDLDALIEELQPDDPDDPPNSPESEAGDPPKPDPELDYH